MDFDLKPGTRVFIYAKRHTALIRATVVRVNAKSVTIETPAGKRAVPLEEIADLAPGERDRLYRESHSA